MDSQEVAAGITRFPVVPLKRLFRIVGGATPTDREEFWGGDIVWVTPEDLGRATQREITGSRRTLSQAGYASCGTQLVREGSIVLSTRAPIGYVGVASTPLSTNQGCKALEPRAPLDSRFYFYVLTAARPLLASLGAGSTFLELRRSDLGNVLVPSPPLARQRAIADYLDRETAEIDTLVGRRQRQAVSLNERSRVLVADQVTGGVGWEWPGPPNGGIAVGKAPPVGWSMRHLGRLLVRIEQGWSPQCENRPAGDGEWGVLKAGAVNSGTLDESENKALPAEVVPALRYEVRPGDLLVSRANTRQLLGSTAIVGDVRPRLLVCDKLFRIEPRPMLDRNFLALALATPFARYQLERDATGASPSMQNIGQDSLKRLLLFLPPLDDQKEIVASSRTIAHQTRAQTRLLQQQVAKLQERRAALVTAGVTGQLDIPTV